ncbi:MAG: preprotein translocase subunit SecA [Acidobacteria bacterium]|jgi:preprotein translocase subunit SecA|nr:preprotein translocase subunit SecA [Acidobacteriota bacterium]
MSVIDKTLAKLFGTKHDRDVKAIQPIVHQVSEWEPRLRPLSDDNLRARTADMKQRLENAMNGGLSQQEALDQILPEAFAVAREAACRTLGMRPFDVQVVGGVVLHQGKIAEMKTGEGKTLVAVLPVYLNALTGRGVHVVTVNDYLARRDADWMGQVYRFLGLTVGCIQQEMGNEERQKAYNCDVTHGQNNEFGFDYLRDNMKYRLQDMVQRGHHFAVVDEVDSILIDEARTPLIISGPSEERVDKYYTANSLIPSLQKERDYQVDEKQRTATLTEEGIARCEKLLGLENLYDPANMEILHCLNQALMAHKLYHKDVEYMIKDGEVVIVDEFTGRVMPGRRWSDGLHQAIEAKENVKIQAENQTLATITFQNYFRLYEKLSGMTGTADTEAAEFDKIYKLDVVVIPTNKPMIRTDHADLVYRTEQEKWEAAADEIGERHGKGQPVLVGTVSIEKSEKMSALLKRRGIPHVVLNAKYHEKEAEIVAQAGRKGAVTIATNMAGRGTDILLGGNPEGQARAKVDPETRPEEYAKLVAQYRDVFEREHDEVVGLGGLHILGTERHESRRIDNQLRGRAGRQGDPGSSRFYLSLEDDLMRLFGGDRLKNMMGKLGMEEGVPIEHPWVTKSIERAQTSVEARNFEIRKHLLEYDDVMNKQRETIYGLRKRVLAKDNLKDYLFETADAILTWLIEEYTLADAPPSQWNMDGLKTQVLHFFGIDIQALPAGGEAVRPEQFQAALREAIVRKYDEKEARLGPELMREYERLVMLQVLDNQWKDHLLTMDHLKEGIGLRAYGQRDPLVEYKREGYEAFTSLLDRMEEEMVRYLMLMEPAVQQEQKQVQRRERSYSYSAPEKEAKSAKPVVRKEEKVGRNDPCPCGSGKKYKKCHGANA